MLPNFINGNQSSWKFSKVVSVYKFLYEKQVSKYNGLKMKIVLNS